MTTLIHCWFDVSMHLVCWCVGVLVCWCVKVAARFSIDQYHVVLRTDIAKAQIKQNQVAKKISRNYWTHQLLLSCKKVH
jgi:hypothetical protein